MSFPESEKGVNLKYITFVIPILGLKNMAQQLRVTILFYWSLLREKTII